MKETPYDMLRGLSELLLGQVRNGVQGQLLLASQLDDLAGEMHATNADLLSLPKRPSRGQVAAFHNGMATHCAAVAHALEVAANGLRDVARTVGEFEEESRISVDAIDADQQSQPRQTTTDSAWCRLVESATEHSTFATALTGRLLHLQANGEAPESACVEAAQVAADALAHASRAGEFISGLDDLVPSHELAALVEALRTAKAEQTDSLEKLRAMATRVRTTS